MALVLGLVLYSGEQVPQNAFPEMINRVIKSAWVRSGGGRDPE